MCNAINIRFKPVPGIQIVGMSRLRLRRSRKSPPPPQKKREEEKKVMQGT